MVLREMLNNNLKLLVCRLRRSFNVSKKAGLTLVEILIALAIVLILLSLSLPMLGSWPFKVQTTSANAQLVQAIRLTREKSLSRLNNQSHGIFFDNRGYTIFQGDSYINRQIDYDLTTWLDKGLQLSWELNGLGGASEIVFNQEGFPSRQGKIVITSRAGESSGIIVNQLGIVTFVNDYRCTPDCLGKYCGDDNGCLGTCSALSPAMSVCVNGVPKCGEGPACLTPQTCGGGGTPNVCGCATETDTAFCSRLGKNCGSVTALDNCGVSRTVICGTCTSPATCGGGGTPNVCGCATETDTALCTRLGKNCGSLTATDKCGVDRTISSCGSCTPPQYCGGGGTPNVCGGCAPMCTNKCGGNDSCGANCPNTCLAPNPYCDISNMTCQSSDNHPSVQARSLIATNTRANSSDLTWTRGSGQGVVVFINRSATVIAQPVDGVSYNCDKTSYSLAPTLPFGGGKCLYVGSGNILRIKGLSAMTSYIIKVYEYNIVNGVYYYNLLNNTYNPRVITTPRA